MVLLQKHFEMTLKVRIDDHNDEEVMNSETVQLK